ncbi:chemotaxis protein CheX [Oceanidesulfovibrio marinus]|uniref:Chemotaxis protein CheX n=1 Tax=Oceanidesulfovibrio marinus TaxID=370038 RepID=A0A6P1ZLX0_9BACT|nr:chemotaxis protein CheX [Oceanidesulfovibrio marinus]QJT08800.1 chemotaxis protein CheX [Oceanidesulfovibrio marinus]TVM36772.1 chemotaxis protein CheX [Oceanidesulfovibrio marinus]
MPSLDAKPQQRRHTLDVSFINPFLNAVIEVLRTMAMTETEPGKPYIKQGDKAHGDVTGLIAVTGHSKGSFALTFPEPCARAIISAMLSGEELAPYGHDVRDGVGELTNMIAGLARRDLAHIGMKFHASVPEVLMGPDHVVEHLVKAPVLCIPFTCPHGEFVVEVCLDIS